MTHSRGLNPMNDLVFKKVFTAKENQDILLGFIQDMTGKTFQDATCLTPYNLYFKQLKEGLKGVQQDRRQAIGFTEVDIRARDKSGQAATIEMQVLPESWFLERSMYYLSETYRQTFDGSKQSRAEKYRSIQNTYGINVTHFDALGDGRAFHYFDFVDRFTGQKISDMRSDVSDLQLCYLNLTSHDFSHIDNEQAQKLKQWQAFFKQQPLNHQAPSYIQKAVEVVNSLSLNQEEREVMNIVEEHWVTMEEYVQDALEQGEKRGLRKGIEEGLQKGLQKGREQGREEGKGETLLDLYEDNVLTYTQLLAYSQLNKEELDHLIEQRQAEKEGQEPFPIEYDDEWER